MTILQDVLNKKDILCKERDLTAELYNLWITKMHDFQDDNYKYEMYLKMIDNLEPYANMIKEEIKMNDFFPLNESLSLERKLLLWQSSDHDEGINSFIEKRDPVYEDE